MCSSDLSIISIVVLLVVSTILGFMDKSVEMGLAIVAGAIGLAFSNIDKISRFEGAGFKAEMWKKMEAVIEKETEQEQDMATIETLNTDKENELDTSENKVLEALNSQKYTWRTLSGICKQMNLSEIETKTALNKLTKMEFVKKTKGAKGLIWSLTSLGRRQLIVIALLKQDITKR